MKILRLRALIAAMTIVLAAQPAVAQTWMTSDGKMRISGKYREGNEVRVETFGIARRDPGTQYNLALHTVAKLSHDKGFPRFALTKVTSCGLMTAGGLSQCRLVARMLQEGEILPAKGGRIITYYRTENVLVGQMNPEGK